MVNLDCSWIESLFPNKDASKRVAWLKVLIDNEFDTVNDLGTLSPSDWEQISLPLAVRSKMQQAVTDYQKSTTADLPTLPVATAVNSFAAPLATVTQVDCIVLDVSASMRSLSSVDTVTSSLGHGNQKTREEISKLLFHTLVDKLVALELDHAVGLIAFGNDITTIKSITKEYERFHDELGRLDANQGATKLFDAIKVAAQTIQQFVIENNLEQNSDLQKRIVVLTDGDDNASSTAAWQVAAQLQQYNITLDALPVGGQNRVLQSMTAATNGGLSFELTSVEQAVGLFEREAALHVAFREQGPPPKTIGSLADLRALETNTQAVQQVASAVPKVVHAPVMSAATVEKVAATPNAAGPLKRIMKEYSELMKQPVAGWSAFVSADDPRSWKAVMAGPVGTVYEDGNWLVTLQFPENYPFTAPRVRFVTPIYHCNISADGAVCLDVLQGGWNPTITMPKLFRYISELVSEPNADDPLDAYKGQLFKDDKSEYELRATQHKCANAGLTFVELVKTYNLNA